MANASSAGVVPLPTVGGPLPPLIPQETPQDLSGRRLRDCIGELERPDLLVAGDAPGNMVNDLGSQSLRGRRLLTGLEDDERLWYLARFLVGNRDHRGVSHRGVGEE